MIRFGVVGLLALAAPFAPANAQDAQLPAIAGTRLDVSAEGRVTRRPDFVGIGAGVSTLAPNASEAMRQNAAKMESIRGALRRAGIADRDIRTSMINLSAAWNEPNNGARTFEGYLASNQLNIRFRDVSSAGAIIDALVGAGANQIDGPNFGLDRPDTALDEARTLAIANARARADLYARGFGMRVKRVLSVNESGSNSPRSNFASLSNSVAAMPADSGIDPGVQVVTVTVYVSFELE